MRSSRSYRGRNRGRSALQVLVVVLLFILILTFVGFFLLDPYIVYTDDGVRFDFSFFDTVEPTPSVAVEVAPTTVVVATPTPEPTPEPQRFRAISVTQSDLLAGAVADQVAQGDATAAIFDMKGDDGLLGYVSDLTQAKSLGTSASDAALTEAILSVTNSDVYTIARISCYRDNLAPYNSNSLALRTTTGNWWDNESNRWLSPAVSEVNDYLSSICRELAALGFDEILLDNCAYPTQSDGEVDSLTSYPIEERAAQVESLYMQVNSALSDYPATMISIVASEDAFAREGNESGQTFYQLAYYADRVWIDCSESDRDFYVDALVEGGMEDADQRTVLLTDALPTQQYGCWGILTF